MKRTFDNPTATLDDLLADWDAGEGITSLEMGGLGPGYEQAIQVLAIEIVRDHKDKDIPTTEKEWETFGDDTVRRINEACGGFSGAQVGAAKSLAMGWLRDGYPSCIDRWHKVPELRERIIIVSNFWPNARANNAVVVDSDTPPATPPVDPNAPPAPVTP